MTTLSSSALRVFITGASSGLGHELAKHYAAQGAHVGLVSRRIEPMTELIATLPGGAAHHGAYALDVTDAPAMSQAAKAFIERFGLPDIVIANAGIAVGTLTEHMGDLKAFDAVMRTNVLGVATTFASFALLMRKRGSGRLVGISSVAGVRGLPGSSAYSASKAALSAYLEALRVEMHGSGVKVINIRPGFVATPMTAVNPYPMPFILQPDEAARRFARAIKWGRAVATIPWQMACVAQLMKVLPCWLYDRIMACSHRIGFKKPRDLSL